MMTFATTDDTRQC